jgi:hypothetical protein
MRDHWGMSRVPERSPFVGVAVAALSVAVITVVNYGLREIAPACRSVWSTSSRCCSFRAIGGSGSGC